MDWWKIVLVVILIIVLIAALAQIAALDVFSGAGLDSLWELATPAENSSGVAVDWAPIDVGRELFVGLFVGLSGDGMTLDVWAVLTGAFGAAFVVVGIAFLLKWITKVTGG